MRISAAQGSSLTVFVKRVNSLRNYTLGVPKANSKSYGIYPFFLQSRKDIQQPETVKTIIPLDQRVANAQVCILYRKAFLFAKKHVLLG